MKYFALLLLLLVGCSAQVADIPTRPEISGKDFTWHKTELKIAVDPMLESDKIKILNAANEWSEYSGVHFVLTDDLYDTDIAIFYNPYLVYEVYGITINCFDKTKAIVRSNIHLSSMCLLFSDDATRVATYRHEFGHVLGLDHSNIKSDLMYESHNSEQNGNLSDNDKLRMKSLYGKEN